MSSFCDKLSTYFNFGLLLHPTICLPLNIKKSIAIKNLSYHPSSTPLPPAYAIACALRTSYGCMPATKPGCAPAPAPPPPTPPRNLNTSRSA